MKKAKKQVRKQGKLKSVPVKLAQPAKLVPDPGYDWLCLRCGHQWRSRVVGADKPVCCSGCSSAYWDRPRRNGLGGRAKQAKRVDSKMDVRTQAQKTQKVPVAIVGTAYPIIEDFSTPEDTVEFVDSRTGELIGEIYGILPPPPSVANRLKREQEQATSPAQIKPVSSHVIDPLELTAEDQARLDRLIEKSKLKEAEQKQKVANSPEPEYDKGAKDVSKDVSED